MENTGAIHSEVSQTQTVHTAKRLLSAAKMNQRRAVRKYRGLAPDQGPYVLRRLILCDYHAKALEQHGFAVRTMACGRNGQRGPSPCRVVAERKVAKGLCGIRENSPSHILRRGHVAPSAWSRTSCCR